MKESGSRRTPVSIAERPSAIERKSGIAKKSPPWRKYWKKNEVRPARRTFVRRIAGSMSGSPPRAITRFSQIAKSQITKPPARISQIDGERPNHSGPSGFGLTKPQVPERRIPKTMRPSPAAERPVPTRSSRTFARGALGGDPAGEEEDRDDDQDLAGEDVAPREVGGEEAADDRPDRDRDRGGRGDQTVGARPFAGGEVGGDEGDDRGQDQGGAEALQARPADQQDPQVRCQRGDQRSGPVDHAADREGAAAAEDLADLAAGDHEGGHHQRVEGDRGLDAGDARVEVLGDGRHRDVHHRAVEHHQELPRAQRREDQPGRGARFAVHPDLPQVALRIDPRAASRCSPTLSDRYESVEKILHKAA